MRKVTERDRPWIISLVSLSFIILQSACTAVMTLSSLRVLIGLTSFAAAAGLREPATGFHADTIRIPMMVIAVAGALTNFYVVWRIRSLRSRPASQWRRPVVSPRRNRSEIIQVFLALLTLILVAAEYMTHLRVHNV